MSGQEFNAERTKLDANYNDMSEYQVGHLGMLRKASSEYGRDPESMSICPLLTPSPTGPEFQAADPLSQALEQKQIFLAGKSPSPDLNQDEETALLASSPSSSYGHPLDPLKGLTFERPSNSSGVDLKIPGQVGCSPYSELDGAVSNHATGNLSESKKLFSPDILLSSDSTNCVSLPENASSAQLLRDQYRHLDGNKLNEIGKFVCQDTSAGPAIDLTARNPPADFAFITWNWRLIRKSFFWTIVSSVIACFCILIGLLATVPRRCYPPHAWYHGSVFYEVFPASFQDSDGDGVGDLRGIAFRVSYLSKIGVQALRLNSIFPADHYPEAFDVAINLTEIDRSLGNFRDFEYLVSVTRSKNISLILDLPIYPYVKNLGEMKVSVVRKNVADKITNVVHNHRSHRSPRNRSRLPPELVKGEFAERKRYLKPYIDGGIAGLMKSTSDHLNSISQSLVEEAIEFWFQRGVDGIYLKGLDHYVTDSKFLVELNKWMTIKEMYREKGENKMLMCDHGVLNLARDEETRRGVMESMDLLDVYLDVANGTSHIKEEVNRYQSSGIFDKHSYPWIHWNIGNVQTKRLARRVENNFGAILFQFLLPGTISIFYGDEIGLTEIHDPHLDHRDLAHVHQLAPMKWHPNGTGFTRADSLPWLPFAKAARTNDDHEQVLAKMTAMRRDAPSIYMNSIWKDDESLSNWAFRFSDENLIVLERSYPRRNAYVVVYNAGSDEARNDLSAIYYRGELVQDSHGRSGIFMRFNDLKLGSGEAFVVKLDK